MTLTAPTRHRPWTGQLARPKNPAAYPRQGRKMNEDFEELWPTDPDWADVPPGLATQHGQTVYVDGTSHACDRARPIR
jgi:hypothetical protein